MFPDCGTRYPQLQRNLFAGQEFITGTPQHLDNRLAHSSHLERICRLLGRRRDYLENGFNCSDHITAMVFENGREFLLQLIKLII